MKYKIVIERVGLDPLVYTFYSEPKIENREDYYAIYDGRGHVVYVPSGLFAGMFVYAVEGTQNE